MSIQSGQTALASDMNSVIPIGVPLPFFGDVSNLPTDHLILDGSTIGVGSSGATARANADTETLFTLLWNSIANTELIIQTSGGSPTTRGASAAADFAAHKRLPLPDLRANTLGGYKSGDANFGTLGKTVGEATHVLTTPELPSHNHPISGNTLGGGGSGSVGGASGGYLQIANSVGSSGGGGAHNNIQPTFTVNWIIRYKSYA